MLTGGMTSMLPGGGKNFMLSCGGSLYCNVREGVHVVMQREGDKYRHAEGGKSC